MTIIPETGAINWTPTEAQGPSVNTITVVVTDNGSPPLSATNSFIVTVNEVNNPPSLTVPANQTINELTTLSVSASATDPDLPANILTFSLLSPPIGMTINPASGLISWTPTEAQGPSTNAITIVVTDNGQPPLGATNSFMVVVNELNSPPVLPSQTNRIIVGLTGLIVTNTAGDPDLPTNTLSYTLVGGPTNAVIDTNGVITWSPTTEQVPGTNVFTTVVSDFNPWAVDFQELSATNTFLVVVEAIHNGPVLPLQTNRTIAPFTTLVVTNTAFDTDIPACHLTYTLADGPAGAAIDSNGIITWSPGFQQALVTRTFVTVVTDDAISPLSDTNSFTVTVNPPPPPPVILDLSLTNGTVTIHWTAVAAKSYRLEYKDNFEDANWNAAGSNITANQGTAVTTDNVGDAAQRFYRVVLLP
jgi:hypothetical protein